jgi:phosphoribosylformylglycinamidine cyclo-ligase
MSNGLSYKQSGVDIDVADAAKQEMARALETNNSRVLNKLGAFASLFDIRFPEYEHPVLVLKTEEPGSKQKLAFQYGRRRSICYDTINHLVNDVIVMGATPLAVQDAIICGKLEKDVVIELVAGFAEACKEQGCVLTGGETSEQPGVLEPGLYILTTSMIGIVEKSKILDGSTIAKGDYVLAIASNGLHTNGYTLVRALIQRDPEILQVQVDGESFLDLILRPHTCYYHCLKDLFEVPELHGLAHITGGGIQGNLNRILPAHLSAEIDLTTIRVLPVFSLIQERGQVPVSDMLRTFNLGVGMTAVVAPSEVEAVCKHLNEHGCECYQIGWIEPGGKDVRFIGELKWD